MARQQAQQPSKDKRRFFYGYIVVAAAFIIIMIAWGTNYSFGVFFTPLLATFGWTRAMTSGAFSLAVLVEGLGGMLMGRLNDRFGARFVVTICGLVLGLGYILMSQTNHIWQLYLFYGLTVGIGLSASWVPPVSTVARWFIGSRAGMMTGIAVAGNSAGALLMSPIANQLVLAHGWRISYIIIGATALVFIMAVAQLLKRPATQIREMEDDTNVMEKYSTKFETGQLSLHEIIRSRQLWLTCGAFVLGYVSIA